MKRIILSSAFLFIGILAFAQPTQLDVNFDDGAAAFIPIHAIDEIQIEVSNILKNEI